MRVLAALSIMLVVLAVLPGRSWGQAEETVSETGRQRSDAGVTARDTIFAMPAIIVEAPRVPRSHDDVFNRTGFVAVLDLGERHDRVEDLSTVLAQMVGIRVRQYGGLGSFATVSIRGSSSNQVDVFLDGVPLNDAYIGVTNLGDLPLDGVDQIEVYRGYTPPHLGSSSIGGAINLTTPSAPSKSGAFPRIEFRESHGSFDTVRRVLSLWSGTGSAKLLLHGSKTSSRGDFEFVDDKATPENDGDDELTRRRNNDFEMWNLLGRLELGVPVVGDVILSHSSLMREQGVPGLGSHQSLSARAERDRHLSSLRVEPAPWLGHRLVAFAGGFYSFGRERFHDRDREISIIAQESDNEFEAAGGNIRAKFDVPKLPLSLEAFYEGKRERFYPRSELPRPTEGPERVRHSHNVTLSADWYLFGQNLVLSPAGRVVRMETEFYDPPVFPWLPPTPQGKLRHVYEVPQFGFRWHPASFVTCKGNWGHYVRIPTMLELFGNVGSVTGNASLSAEEGLNRDFGVVLSRERLGMLSDVFVELVYLNNKVENMILFFIDSNRTSQAENAESARIEGWELSLSGMPASWLRVSGNYTRLESRYTGPIPYYHGNDLPGRPRDDAALFVSIASGRYKAGYELHYLGRNFLDRANHYRVPARQIRNLTGGVALFSGRVSVMVEGRNLSDEWIEDVNGFPLPGRSYYATIGLSL